MNVLILFNQQPYNGTDVTWNGLRLAEQLIGGGLGVRVFLMNDAVDLAREESKPPEGYEDLVEMLKALIARGVVVKVCGTCNMRCGIHKGKDYFQGANKATMAELAEWVKESDRIISF